MANVAITIEPVGYDHGNGNNKGKTQYKILNQPSVYGLKSSVPRKMLGEVNLKLDTFIQGSDKQRVEYVWGEDILKIPNLFTSFGYQDRYLQPAYKVLSDFALAKLFEGNASHVTTFIVTGVPSREKGTKKEEDLKALLRGDHIITMNGIDKKITVKDVEVIPQPLGTIIYLYLDDNANVVDEDIAEEYVGIIDAGAGTCDCDALKALEIVDEDRDTFNLGMKTVYKKVADAINDEDSDYGATPEIVEAQFDNEEYIISKRFKIEKVKFEAMKEKYIQEVAEMIIARINSRWTNRKKFDRIILTGGSVKYFRKYFEKWEKDIIVIEDSQMANAIGFYRYAVMLLTQGAV